MKPFYNFVIVAVLLSGCMKNASETATETSLHQVNAIEQQIKKDCPAVKIDEQMNALRDSIKNQLATCETEKRVLEERNNTLLVILIGIAIVFGVSKLAKRGVL